MGLRDAVRDWVPPAVLRLRRGLRSDGRVFSSYDDALRLCGAGYDAGFIAEVVVAKTEVLRAGLTAGQAVLDLGSFRTLIGMGFAQSAGPLRVLDFGGAGGYHSFIARVTAGADARLDWRVVETPAMVRAAARLANDELSFFSSLDDATRTWDSPPDLVFASGVLQYLPDPLEALAALLSLRAPRAFVTRTGLSPDGTTRVIVQHSTLAANGPGPLPAGVADRPVLYPATFVPEAAFEQVIEEQYRIVARVKEDVGAYAAGGTPLDMHGYLCQLR